MPTGRCVYCNMEVEMKLLKKCGACGGVTYCSKECQKLSWKLTHKYTCVPNVLPPGQERALKYYGRIINSWRDVWNESLDHLALLALDLANNPGRNITHCMWLEFVYTGQKHSRDMFAIYRGCIRTAEEVLAETPQLKIMRDPPPLIGKRIRYVMVFHFEEAGKPTQSFLRARSWELPKSLEVSQDDPTGWEAVYGVIRWLFARVEEEEREKIVLVTPVDGSVVRQAALPPVRITDLRSR